MAKEIKENNKIKELTTAAMKDLSSMIDVNTVIGKPFTTPDGSTIIPITKVTMGFMTGGGEYGEIKTLKSTDPPFAGGSGAVISVKPVGFLLSKNKGIKLISAENDVYTKLFQSAEEFIENLKK